MTLTDSGPLAALLNRNDQGHSRCVAAAPSLSAPLITTMPCFMEAMYFLGRDTGWHAQARLWQLVSDGRLEVRPHTGPDLERMLELMEKYADTPMDLADASLVALAESLNETRVFTLDSHFRVYRLRDRRALQVTPSEQVG